MLDDGQISHLVDYVNAKDCFPGISIGGGVCYFLRTKGIPEGVITLISMMVIHPQQFVGSMNMKCLYDIMKLFR